MTSVEAVGSCRVEDFKVVDEKRLGRRRMDNYILGRFTHVTKFSVNITVMYVQDLVIM